MAEKNKSRVVYVNFPQHDIAILGSSNVKLPLGHAGIIFVDPEGRTQYYEYGRYSGTDSKVIGEVLPTHQGNYRRIRIPDMNGMSEEEFTQRLLQAFPSETKIETSWRDTSDYSDGLQYILDDSQNKNRQPYDWVGCSDKTCGSVAREAFDEGSNTVHKWLSKAGKAIMFSGLLGEYLGRLPSTIDPALFTRSYTAKRKSGGKLIPKRFKLN